MSVLSFFSEARASKNGEKNSNDTEQTYDEFHEPIVFENIGEDPYYYKRKKIKRIRKLQQKNKIDKVIKNLEKYISQFGIQNFYKDTDMLWRLGQLYEQSGRTEDAKVLYRYALRHLKDSVNQVRLFYDSLTVLDKIYYVPVQYYYNLVGEESSSDTIHPPDIYLNIGTDVNSASADYGPTLNMEGDKMIFSSRRNEIKEAFGYRQNEDLFVTEKWNDNWVWAEPLDDINSQYNEGSPFLAADGKTLLFVKCDCPDCYGDCDIFQAILRDDTTWGYIKNMGYGINSQAWDSQPTLTPGGDTLYFASDRLGGFGLADLYYSVKDKDGNWLPAKNLGPKINTSKSEVSPFYHQKENILYFSSNGQIVNFGSFDIYKARFGGPGRVGEPKNIGPLVNGAGSEYYFTIDSKSEFLYYARSEAEDIENLDLHSFPLPMGAQPQANTKFTGQVLDTATGLPLKGIASIIDLDQGIAIAPQFLRPDGSFEFDLINNGTYLLVIQGEDFFRIEEIFKLDGDTERLFSTMPISSKLKFESIEFLPGDSTILPAMEDDIYKVIEFLLDHPDFKLTISGHTDSSGDPDDNHRLSQARAEAIRTYIIDNGRIEPDRVDAIGYGFDKPIVENEQSDEDRHMNRRVEFEIFRN
jgi:outer membrane protein OmpA-like peptidoglycan-associated protein